MGSIGKTSIGSGRDHDDNDGHEIKMAKEEAHANCKCAKILKDSYIPIRYYKESQIEIILVFPLTRLWPSQNSRCP